MSQRAKQHYLAVAEYIDQSASVTKLTIVYGRDVEEATELGAKTLGVPDDWLTEVAPLSSLLAYNRLRPYFRKTYIKRLVSCGDYQSSWTFSFGSIT